MNLSRSSTKTRFDVVIIGGGHNGLTCACYLAQSGLSVGVFERRSILGGAAVTEEFHPGFRNSTASYTVSLLNPKVIRDLRLAEHGLKVLERPLQNFLPLPDGRALTAGPAQADTLAAIRSRSPRATPNVCPPTTRMLDAAVELLRAQLLETPPTDPRRLRDLWGALQLGRHFRKLPAPVQRDIHELFTRSAGDLLDHWFETDAVKALFGFDAVVGNYASPYTPGSGYVLLHHVFGEVNGKPGVWGHAVGGMGAITQAMAARSAPARRASRNRRAGETHRDPRHDRHRHRARGRTRHRGQHVRGECRTQAALSEIARRCRPARRVPRAHRATARGLGDVPHERRAFRIAEIHRRTAQRRRRASRFRNHSRAFARLHGSRVRRSAHRRHVATRPSWKC